jgi:glutamyl-tRNA synthetase/glutamyl-Q tRNA(Asp) synthetase
MITRFAPSLTGYLHLGHVLHMLYVWGIAQSRGARIVCRIEDHDQGRARPEYELAILENMKWLGFVPDLGISVANSIVVSEFRQSDCDEYYTGFLQSLERRGLVYGCECSRKQVALTQPNGAEELCYSGTCSEKGLPFEGNTVRFRIPDGDVVFQDLKLGECRQTPRNQCGDFSLRDRNGQWTYQFCCVCDDIRQGVDLVIRGEDILSSTARQIMLFQALEVPVPQYFHHRLLCDVAGNKLSKRQHSESISQLRDAGASPEEVFGKAVAQAGLAPTNRPVSLSTALQRYIA